MPTVYDDFEDGIDPGWQGASDFSISSDAHSGSQACQQTGGVDFLQDDGGDFPVLSQGEKFYFWAKPNYTTTLPQGVYFTQDESYEGGFGSADRYRFGASGDDTWRIWRSEGGTSTSIASTSFGWGDQNVDEDAYHLHEVKIESNGSHTATVYDTDDSTVLAQVTVTDTTFTSGGVGVGTVDNSTGHLFDDIEKDSLGGGTVTESASVLATGTPSVTETVSIVAAETASVTASGLLSAIESAAVSESASVLASATSSVRERFGDVFWGYVSDWDSAQSESNVQHLSDEVSLSGADEGTLEGPKKQW